MSRPSIRAVFLVALGTLALEGRGSSTGSGETTPLDAIATQLIEEFNHDGYPGLSRSEFRRALTTDDGAPWRDELPPFEPVPPQADPAAATDDVDSAPRARSVDPSSDLELRFAAAFSIADADGDGSLSFIELIDALAHLRADTRVVSAMGRQ